MYKKVIIQNDGRLILDLPVNMRNKIIEVFVLPVEEGQERHNIKNIDNEELVDYIKLRG